MECIVLGILLRAPHDFPRFHGTIPKDDHGQGSSRKLLLVRLPPSFTNFSLDFSRVPSSSNIGPPLSDLDRAASVISRNCKDMRDAASEQAWKHLYRLKPSKKVPTNRTRSGEENVVTRLFAFLLF
eukprot:767852-Hanusia_phi.AAC.1